VFVDEFAANERTKDRKHGWAPIGEKPIESRPHKRLVLIMHNASIHRGPEIKEPCSRFGIRLEYLPPHSLGYNPIEQSFVEYSNRRHSASCLTELELEQDQLLVLFH